MNKQDWAEKLGLAIPSDEPTSPTSPPLLATDSNEHIHINTERDDAFKIAKENVNFLGILAAPSVFIYALPPVLLAVWQLLSQKVVLQRDFSQLALGLPRGIGKTMLMKLFVLYCILFTNKKFIVVICATATFAENFIADVFSMLSEPNIRQIFGDWQLAVTQDRQDQKNFGFRGRNIVVAAIGAGGSVRGLNLELERPDVMIFDDVQKREEAHNAEIVNALEIWMIATAMKAKSPHGCLFVYVGNMYPYPHTILKKLKNNPTWISFITGAILADGTALWEELQPLRQLLNELENDISMGHPEIWFSEVMNDTDIGINVNFDITAIPDNPYEQDEVPQGMFIVIDPATDKKDSDLITIGRFNVYDSKPVCMKLIEDRLSPGEMIRQALVMGLESGCRVICVESTAYQFSALYWFNFITMQMGITGFHFCEIFRTKMSKNAAIKYMFSQLKNGKDKETGLLKPPELYLHSRVRSQVNAQASQWNQMKTNNTDGILDILAFATKCLELYGHLMPVDGILLGHEYDTPAVVTFNSPF